MRIMLLSFVALMISLPAMASDAAAEQALDKAYELYETRTIPADVETAETLLTAAIKVADDADLKYEILILHSRFVYWRGTQATKKADVIRIHKEGMKISEQASTLNPELADAYYFTAVHLGRWAKANGVIASLSEKDKLFEVTRKAAAKNTFEGGLGNEFESYGTDRILGRLYYSLPGFSGGDKEEAIKHLKVAYDNAPNYALNVVYYAEALSAGTAEQLQEAKDILKLLLSKDPNTYNPARIPETIEEFRLAKELSNQLGK